MPFTSHSVALPSGPVTYWQAGEGRPLLYLHAAGGVQVTKPLEALAKTRQVVILIFPGFDGTPYHDGVDTMERLGDLAAEFLDKLIGKPCDVMSQSFGGWVSLWLAVKHPEKVEQLVLECPAGFQIDGGGLPGPQEIFGMLYAHPEKIPHSTKPQDQMAASMQAPRHYIKGFVATDLHARLGEVQARTLILHGTLDRLAPQAGMQLLQSKLPHSHLHYLYDSAHVIEVDQPERFLKLVSSFLERGDAYIVNFGAEGAAAS
jgi:pimeloyl-ACP methyl ester carboxylesterase